MTAYPVPNAIGGQVNMATGDAASLAAADQKNTKMVNFPAQWSVTHAPAVNVQATITKAAGATGVRHVCTGIHAKIVGGTTAPAAIQGTVNLRDGASGAGTILKSFTMVLAAAIGAKDEIALTGLNIPGSAATAMTLEFAAAGGANTFECVSMDGYDVS